MRLLIALLALVCTAQAQVEELKARWTTQGSGTDAKTVIEVRFYGTDRQHYAHFDSDEALKAALPGMVSVRRGTAERLGERLRFKVASHSASAHGAEVRLSTLRLEPEKALKPLEEDLGHVVVLETNSLDWRDGTGTSVPVRSGPITALNADNLHATQSYLQPRTRVEHLDVGGGDDGGAVSYFWRRSLDELSAKRWLHLDISTRGDFNMDADQRAGYFDSLEGEFRGYGTFDYDLGDRARYGEFGLHYRLESDQAFDAVDQVVGVEFRTYTQDPVSGFLADLFRPEGKATVTPLVGLEFNWVDELREGDEPRARVKPDTSDGDFRAEAFFDWSLPLGRDLDWDFLPAIGTVRELDLVTELRYVYDFDESELFERTKIVLRFSPEANADKVRSAFELSYVAGESAPLFDQIETLLVGLRISR